jgi:hypothetical protein
LGKNVSFRKNYITSKCFLFGKFFNRLHYLGGVETAQRTTEQICNLKVEENSILHAYSFACYLENCQKIQLQVKRYQDGLINYMDCKALRIN